MSIKLTEAQKNTRRPNHLPRHYYPGYVFIPKTGYFQARKIGLTKETVQADPRFHKTRMLAREFAQVTRWAKLIRTACCIDSGIKDNPCNLIGALTRILQDDPISVQGARHILLGGLHKLEMFNLNKAAPLEKVCTIDWDIDYRCNEQEVLLSIPSFVPDQYIHPPQGISHCRIYMATICLDINAMTFRRKVSATTILPIRKMHIPATVLRTGPMNEKGKEYIVLVGIHWYTRAKDNKVLQAKIPGPLQIMLAG